MKQEIEGLVEISKYSGMREDLVQAGGGNTSVKDEDYMYVKSSGCQLSEVREDFGYSKVDYKKLNILLEEFLIEERDYEKDVLSKIENDMLSKCLVEGNRPSIETFLHAMSGKYVIHSHALVANMLLTNKKGKDILKDLFPEAVFVDYYAPGLRLAIACYREYKRVNKSLDIVFFKNHGILVSDDTYEAVIQKNEDIINKIAQYLNINNRAETRSTRIYNTVKAKFEGFAGIVYHSQHHRVLEYARLLRGEEWNYRLSPDSIVYIGKQILSVTDESELDKELTVCGKQYGVPGVIVCEGQAYILSENIKKAKDIESVLAWTAEILMGTKNKDVCSLHEADMNFLLNWDAEKYRKSMK
jgi:uncharacterized oxidoreductase yuxG